MDIAAKVISLFFIRERVRVEVACAASVSSRVITRKLERKQKKGRHSIFFCSCPGFLDEPREETLATQARVEDLT